MCLQCNYINVCIESKSYTLVPIVNIYIYIYIRMPIQLCHTGKCCRLYNNVWCTRFKLIISSFNSGYINLQLHIS